MERLFRHLAALAAIVCLALVAGGCGDEDSRDGTLPTGGGAASDNTVEKSEGDVPPEVKAKQEALAKKAAKMEAEAKKAGTTTPPEGRAGQRCPDTKGYTNVSTLGFECTDAVKLIAAGEKKWATLPTKKTTIAGYECMRSGETDSYLRFLCIKVGKTIQFRLPTG